MDGLVFHGCAIPLPFPKRPGLKQQGPRPGRLFSLCQDNPLLRWMLWVGGAEAVADYFLERIELATTITERRKARRMLSSAQNSMSADLKEFANQLATCMEKPTSRAAKVTAEQRRNGHQQAWELKKAAIIRADEQRRQQRVVRVPASPPKPTRQQLRAAAERVIRELRMEQKTLVEVA